MSLDEYRPVEDAEDYLNPWRVFLGGALATAVMTAVLYGLEAVGGKIDLASILGSVLGAEAAPPFSRLWWTGMLWHLNNGIVLLPFFYAYFVEATLPRLAPWERGATWGATIWLLLQAVILPMVGGGFFSRAMPEPGLSIVGTLVAHLAYGAILGAVVGPHPARPASLRLVAEADTHRRAS